MRSDGSGLLLWKNARSLWQTISANCLGSSDLLMTCVDMTILRKDYSPTRYIWALLSLAGLLSIWDHR